MFGIKKEEDFVVVVSNATEHIAAKAILEEKWANSSWNWHNFDDCFYFYIVDGEVHCAIEKPSDKTIVLSFNDLKNWRNNNFEFDSVKEMTVVEISKALGYEVKIVK